jgi:uncharacterized OsmC-like protein/pimeloyl-ACP methyl ester carboxylesterase
MSSRSIRFDNGRGQQLSGILDQPAGRVQASALFAHCFTCSKNLRAVHQIAQALNAAGVSVLRFDFTGLGSSEGDFAAENVSSNVQDLVSAAQFLEREGLTPQILIGHSLGGAAILQAAPLIPSSVAVATIGAPSTAAHVARLVASEREAIERDGEAEVKLAGRSFRIRRQFLDDLAAQPLPQSVRSLRRALLILHSPVDEVVDIGNAAAMFEQALHPKSFISLDRADHLLTRDADARYVGTVLAAWATRYLELEEPDATLTAAPGEVAARCDAQGFRTDVRLNGHSLVTDEPESAGGTNLGPSPYDLLSAALAACTSITLQVYARHKQLPLTSATVRVRHGKIHASDCETCETRDGKIDRFERVLELEGALSADQRQRLLEIANKCPVHRTLESEMQVETTLAE